MKQAKILDCTLRDGAHINKGLFGRDRSKRILAGLSNSGIEYVELGNIEPKLSKEGSTYFNSVDHAVDFFSLKKDKTKNLQLGLMTRTDRCELSNIKPNEDIDFIRIALYPEHISEVIKYSNKLIGYGYKLYLNLIAVTSYETEEIKKLLSRLNESIDFSGLSIVDTYGALTEERLLNIMPIFEEIGDKKKEIGLHLHENLNRSSLLYNLFIKNTSKENLIIDCSLGGMGRVPGNFPTEVCANLMNSDFNKDYLIDELAQTASAEIQSFQEVNKWGYLPIYATSAILNIDRSYPEYFEKKGLSDKKNIDAQEIIANNLSAKKFSENIANNAISILNDKKRHI
jgi:4-hydroxy 2-oxovalerate aldolase